MGSSSDEDNRVLVDQSEDEDVQGADSRVEKRTLELLIFLLILMKASSLTYVLRFGIPNQWANDLMLHLPTSLTPKDQKCVDLIKTRGLRSMNLRQVIVMSYPVYSPTGPLRPHPSASAEAMKRKAKEGSSDKGVQLVILDPQSVEGGAASEPTQTDHTPMSPSTERARKDQGRCPFLFLLHSLCGWQSSRNLSLLFEEVWAELQPSNDGPSREISRIASSLRIFIRLNIWMTWRKLKCAYTTMEVKKNEMEDALKSIAMKEQEAQYKAEIVAWDAELEKLHGENRALAERVKILEAKNQEEDYEHQRLWDLKGSMEEDLAEECLNLRSNILAKLRV
ncbi:hypothetical protein JCGZ_22039 [Jatropha curcas]|uniref:Uncharacterized protein n=1 Tax=Jatropha curcas TaxID=180498 RepID=A0A067JT77_JATCU|nr:hypothetical protein JCGZ_22039 [Jatropha curcas]